MYARHLFLEDEGFVMAEQMEKRRCHRFKVPDGKASYKRGSFLGAILGYSRPYPLVNLSKGGLALLCDRKFRRGRKVMIRLFAPDEEPLELWATVRWRNRHGIGGESVVGFSFETFGSREGDNPKETLDALRRLDGKYGGQGEGGRREVA